MLRELVVVRADSAAKAAPKVATADICNRPTFGREVVKSAGRVLQILEFFDDIRRDATVIEVAAALGYPQSSTSVLLRSLYNCGYLDYDRERRTYVTASRVALLGHWASADLVADGPLLELMNELHDRTGHAVTLATVNGLSSQYIHVIQSRDPAMPHVTMGTVRPLAGSGTGFALLSLQADADVTRIVTRTRSEADDPSSVVTVREVLAITAGVREEGHVFTCDMVTAGAAMIAAPLPHRWRTPLAIGVCGPKATMTAAREPITMALLDAVARSAGRGSAAQRPGPYLRSMSAA